MATFKILCALECTAGTLRLLSVANTLLPMVGLIIQSMKEIVWNNPSCTDLENWNGTDRFHFNAIVTDQDLVEVTLPCNDIIMHITLSLLCVINNTYTQTYLPAFEACATEGNAVSFMCSLNAVNGVPSCANGLLQNSVAREKWGFSGFIVHLSSSK